MDPMPELLTPPTDEEDAEQELKVSAWVIRQSAGVEDIMVGNDLQSLFVVIVAQVEKEPD